MPEPRRPRAFNSTLAAPKAPMAKVNVARQKRREEADLVLGSHHEWIKQQPCVLAGRQGHTCRFFEDRPRIEGHHLKSRGSGGQDRNNEIPVDPGLHDDFERTPLSEMCRRWHLDFKSLAADYTNAFDRENA